MARIGLIAGEGKLPMVFSLVAKDKGDTVIAFGLKGVTDEGIKEHVHKMHWLEWGGLQKGAMLLIAERINKIIMLGKLKKELVFKSGHNLDEESKKILDTMNDKKDYTILNGVTKFLNKMGIEVIDSTTYLKELIPSRGTLTKREPTEAEWEDIKYGRDVAKTLSGFDIGQTVAIKEKTVIAIEAMEGTDETIARAGVLVKDGFSVIKVARPNQDMRFDVPLVGMDTLKALIKANGKILALEEKKTLVMDREELVKLADEKGISIIAI